MYQEEVVLCGASAYNKKFYLSEDFEGLPQGIQDELKILCVLYTEDVGGTLELVFDVEKPFFKLSFIQKEKRELLESLEMYFKVFFLGEDFKED